MRFRSFVRLGALALLLVPPGAALGAQEGQQGAVPKKRVQGRAQADKPLLDRPLLDRPLLDRPLLDKPLFDKPLFDEALTLHGELEGLQGQLEALRGVGEWTRGKLGDGLAILDGQGLHGKLALDAYAEEVQFIDDDLAEARETLAGTLHAYGLAHREDAKLARATLVAPKPSWYADDPADSAYRAAYQLFSRQEYRAAADRFSALRAKYPATRYLCDASYYEAFARYRLGTPDDLRTAHQVLDGMGARCAGASRNADVPELLARVDGALARLGDRDARARLQRAASEGRSVCDREERNVKIQALSALAQMDAAGARPILEGVLAQKDECSAPVRREALQLVARGSDAAAVTILARSARSDPDAETRSNAIEWLGRMGSDPAFAAVEELLRTSDDERVQAAAVRAMLRSESPRAQATVRALAERQDVSERLRMSVISHMASKGGTPVEYWRTLYGKVESDELRRAVVNAVDRTSGDGIQFLVRVAGDPATPSSVQAAAVSRVRQSAPIADLYKLFESADTRAVRQAIVSGLAARKEPEATDRLIDIARQGTDPEVRAAAIRYLGQPARKDDPKVRKALADILGGQS